MSGEKAHVALLGQLYRHAAPAVRLLATYRPLICPFGPLLLHVPTGSRVLDIGCGTGVFLALLAAQGRLSAGIGCDISRKSLAAAEHMQATHPNGSLLSFQLAGDAGVWPAGPYDVVSAIDLLHHIPPHQQAEVFQAAAQRVRPGGLLLCKDMRADPWWCGLGNRLHDLALARQWIHYLKWSALDDWARTAGLRRVDRQHWRRFWYHHEMRVYQRREK